MEHEPPQLSRTRVQDRCLVAPFSADADKEVAAPEPGDGLQPVEALPRERPRRARDDRTQMRAVREHGPDPRREAIVEAQPPRHTQERDAARPPDREGAAAVAGQPRRAPTIDIGDIEVAARAADPFDRLARSARVDEPTAVWGETEAVEGAVGKDSDAARVDVDDGELGDAGDESLPVRRPGLRVEDCRGQVMVALAVA